MEANVAHNVFGSVHDHTPPLSITRRGSDDVSWLEQQVGRPKASRPQRSSSSTRLS